MSQETWEAVDAFVAGRLAPHDAALDGAVAASAKAGLPPIQVTPAQGRLLQLLAQANGSRRILEIGTLGGYSTIWLARALPPGGRLVTLERESAHADVAKASLARAGLADRVEVRLGPALESLAALRAERAEPFDFVFVDADKERIPDYLEASFALSRPGTLLVVDNVVRDGALADAASTDPQVRAVRRMVEMLAADPRVSATVIQTVGSKHYDGFALVRFDG